MPVTRRRVPRTDPVSPLPPCQPLSTLQYAPELTVKIRPICQPPYQTHISHNHDPTDKARPTEDNMHHEDERKQQTTLPRMKPHIVALMLHHQQQHTSRRRQQQVRQTRLIVHPQPQTRREHVDILPRSAKSERLRRRRRVPCYAIGIGGLVAGAEVVVLLVGARGGRCDGGDGARAVDRGTWGCDGGERTLRLGDVLVGREVGCHLDWVFVALSRP